jgi:hypothetical protein
MRRFLGAFSLIAVATLAACGPSGGIATASTLPVNSSPSSPLSNPVTAADITTVAGSVVVKADAAVTIAEKAYTAARDVAKSAIASGFISAPTVILLKDLDERASTALFFARTATTRAEQAQAAAKLLTIVGKIEKAAPAPTP